MYFSENPWDGSRLVKVQTRSIAISHTAFMKLTLITWSILILFFLAFAGNTKAGPSTSIKQTEAKAAKPPKAPKPPSNPKAAEIGEEYAYLLEQLIYLSSDYCRYFDKLEAKAGDANYQALSNMCARISKDEQYENVAKIIAEIDKLKLELSVREKDLARLQSELEKKSKNVRPAQANLQALKLTTTLREELEALDEQLEHDIVLRMKKNEISQEAIRIYFNAVLNDSLVKIVRVLGERNSKQVRVYRNAGDDETRVVVADPDDPEAQIIYVPDNPDAPVTVEPKAYIDRGLPGREHFADASFYKEFSDSINVNSTDIDIYITNATGNLSVTNWPNHQISASYVVAISSDKLRQSEEFDVEVQLRIAPEENRIYVESVLPPLDDPKMKVLESRLTITVPADNDLYLGNTSGTISANDIRNNVTIKASTCKIDLHRVEGNVEISNSSGSISAGHVNGDLDIQNRMGPVALFNCSGTIEMDNSFGELSVTDCAGYAVIRNTGAVNVGNHSGNMEITNRSGAVDVSNLEGNLEVINSFEPLRVKDVNGNTKLINANSSIEAFAIEGMVTINNRFGQINTSGISGPIHIENKNGDIIMQINVPVSGPSTVTSNGGQVHLTVGKKSNLLLELESTNGSIDIAGFTATIEDGQPGVQLAKLALGNGSDVFSVMANRSKIFVKPAQKNAITLAP